MPAEQDQKKRRLSSGRPNPRARSAETDDLEGAAEGALEVEEEEEVTEAVVIGSNCRAEAEA